MQITDPVADMLTRIRNANTAKHESVDVPASNLKKAIAKILLDEGYIKSYEVVEDGAVRLPAVVQRGADGGGQRDPLLLRGIDGLQLQRLRRRDADADVEQPDLVAVDVHGVHADLAGVGGGKDLVAAVHDGLIGLRGFVFIPPAEKLAERGQIRAGTVIQGIVEVKKDGFFFHGRSLFVFSLGCI